MVVDAKSLLVVNLHFNGFSLGTQDGTIRVTHPYDARVVPFFAALDAQQVPAAFSSILERLPGMILHDGAVLVEMRDHRGLSVTDAGGVRVKRLLLRPTAEHLVADLCRVRRRADA